ncbi:unnamed protein product [Didymodactylos carnosus]|uniref:N-alpha-acetyltransferase 40 n=1 Tax=Didymodactylos carnosus TaxID=1234261 RepID=A0A8S2RTT8_9BILA|nr:unnamed protein product [Didymodactylos carnosus]CAF4183633.1 unnamed protein product [Didymodactylos carnosus]
MRDIFELFENNMKSFYEISNSSYDPIEKRAELFHRDSRYLLVNDTTDHIVAYSHFRFDIDFKLPVIYIYEIQVTKAYQNLRLGRQIMIILEHLCQLNKMKKLILTVKKSNVHALKFYYRLDYRKDTSDPNDSDTETEYDYFILSKTI